jgi:hypothetical protein
VRADPIRRPRGRRDRDIETANIVVPVIVAALFVFAWRRWRQ